MSLLTKPETIAVYFDGDNVTPSDVGIILQEIKSYGDIIINRVYADWQMDNLHQWSKTASCNGITQIQCGRLSGKNSTDIKLCVDLMKDLLTVAHITLFYIITSDSDYRHVLPEIKLQGKKVHCIGLSQANVALMSHCDQYTKIEVLREASSDSQEDFLASSETNVALSKSKNEKQKVVSATASNNNEKPVQLSVSVTCNNQEGSSSENEMEGHTLYSPATSVKGTTQENQKWMRKKKLYLEDLERELEGKSKLNLSAYKDVLTRKYHFDSRELGFKKFHKFINEWLFLDRKHQFALDDQFTYIIKKSKKSEEGSKK